MASSAPMQHLRSSSNPAMGTCLSAARRAQCTARTVVQSSATTKITSSSAQRTYYQVLGVPADASPCDIRASFRRLAKSLHPDHNKLPDAMEQFKEVIIAYDVLADASSRAEYDRVLIVQALAEAQSIAQASGVKRSSTLCFRRNKATASPRIYAASPRRASGDDFEQFASSGNPEKAGPNGATGSRGSESANYTSIFSDKSRASSSRLRTDAKNGPAYRSIFNARTRSSQQQQPSSQDLSGNAGGVRDASSSSGYASSISNRPSTPTQRVNSASSPDAFPRQPRSTGGPSTNPCIFNGRSISPSLGVRPQQQQPVAATASDDPGPSPTGPRTSAPTSEPAPATSTVAFTSPSERGGVTDPGHVSVSSGNVNLAATGPRPQTPSRRPPSSGNAYCSHESSFGRSTEPPGVPGAPVDSISNPRQSQASGVNVTSAPSPLRHFAAPATDLFTEMLRQQTITVDGSRRQVDEDTVRLQSQKQAQHQAALCSVYCSVQIRATQISSKTGLLKGQEPAGNARSPESSTSVARAPVSFKAEAEAVQATAEVAAAMSAAAEAKRAAAAAEAMDAEAAEVAAAAKVAALEAEARLNAMLGGAANATTTVSQPLGNVLEMEPLLPWTSLQNEVHGSPRLAKTPVESWHEIEKAQGDARVDGVMCQERPEDTRVEMTPLSVAVKPLWPNRAMASEQV